MKETSDVVRIAALKIYNENVLRETGENLQHHIQDACEEYAKNLNDYKAKQLAEKDAEIGRLHERLRGIAMTCDYIWQQDPHAEMRGPLEQIETFLGNKTRDGLAKLDIENMYMKEAIGLTIEENSHLADGENCTLWRLKKIMVDMPHKSKSAAELIADSGLKNLTDGRSFSPRVLHDAADGADGEER